MENLFSSEFVLPWWGGLLYLVGSVALMVGWSVYVLRAARKRNR